MSSESELLMRLFNRQWRDVRQSIRTLQADMARIQRQERAEVAGADPVYDTVGDLPAGFLGARATVADDGTGNPAPYWHDGTAWNKVSVP